MKKNYTFLIALALLFNFNVFAQGPWDFNNTVHNWLDTGNAASLVSGATYATLNINTSGNPQFFATDAGIDSSKKIIAITLQNNSVNTRLQIITNRVGSPPGSYSNIDGLSTNDTGFTTYYVDMSSNAGWTGTVNDITFRFRFSSTGGAGGNAQNASGTDTFFIDNIEVIDEIPSTPRIDYTFNDTSDTEGFAGSNGVTLSQPVAGEIQLDIANTSPFPKFEQTGSYSVDAETYKGVQVTLVNNSPKNRINFVSSDGQIAGGDIVAGTQEQTVEIDLSGSANWSGEQNNWWLQLIENPGSGPVASAGMVTIKQILFVEEVTLSNKKLSANNLIELYPNPVNEKLIVNSTLSIEKIEVYSILGRKTIVQHGNNNTLNTSSLSKGVYLIKVYQENNNISTRKFIKK